MRWLRRRDKGARQVSEATLARLRAEAELEATRRRSREVAQQTAYYAALGDALRELREANHLTELFFTNRRTPRSSE